VIQRGTKDLSENLIGCSGPVESWRKRWHGWGSNLVLYEQQFSMDTASCDLHVLSTCFGCVSVSAGDLHFACWFFIFQGVILWTVALLALIGQVSAHQRVMYVRERKCAYVCAQARAHTILRMCTRARANCTFCINVGAFWRLCTFVKQEKAHKRHKGSQTTQTQTRAKKFQHWH